LSSFNLFKKEIVTDAFLKEFAKFKKKHKQNKNETKTKHATKIKTFYVVP